VFFLNCPASICGAVFGLNYKFKGAPINRSLDWQPSVTFIGDNYSNTNWGGIVIRFAI
jgi:hypothetical protein